MKRILAWIAILLAVGMILSFFAGVFQIPMSLELIVFFLIASLLVGGATSASCYWLASLHLRWTLARLLGAGALAAIAWSLLLCHLLVELIYPLLSIKGFQPSFAVIAPAITFLSLCITTLSTLIEWNLALRPVAGGLDGQAASARSDAATGAFEAVPSADSIAIREGDVHHRIALDSICYLASADDRTVIHTTERQYVTARPLKDLLTALPDRFVRIHKSYALNLSWIARLQYYMGGRYLAYLRDDEETNLPVGRKYAADLRSRMGIVGR
ncbi:MAG: LytTR family transcriptional regulator DNA-binding domain-containing protein [Leptospirales bacterium]|nr:LytTR family transcriptional regulator DNA-binding domain-containing protein [Leptospirales bacterium]